MEVDVEVVETNGAVEVVVVIVPVELTTDHVVDDGAIIQTSQVH